MEIDTIAPKTEQDTTTWENPADAAVRFDFDVIQFERIKKGEVADGRFTFLNIGEQILEIEIVSTCDCIKSEWTSDPVGPNQMGEILFQLDSSEETPGTIFKNVDVIFKNTDAKGYPLVRQLYVKATIE